MKMSAEVRATFAKMGRKGGKARAAALSPERRRAIASLAGQAKQQKAREKAEAAS